MQFFGNLDQCWENTQSLISHYLSTLNHFYSIPQVIYDNFASFSLIISLFFTGKLHKIETRNFQNKKLGRLDSWWWWGWWSLGHWCRSNYTNALTAKKQNSKFSVKNKITYLFVCVLFFSFIPVYFMDFIISNGLKLYILILTCLLI